MARYPNSNSWIAYKVETNLLGNWVVIRWEKKVKDHRLQPATEKVLETFSTEQEAEKWLREVLDNGRDLPYCLWED